MNDARRMFYTQEEIDSMTRMDKIKFKIHSIWYNLTEWFLTLKESDKRWFNNKD